MANGQQQNTGMTPPQEAASLDSVFHLNTYKEGPTGGYQIDWTMQESRVFEALANTGSSLIDSFRTLNEERKQLALAEVESEYQKSLKEWEQRQALEASASAFKQLTQIFGGWQTPQPSTPGFGGVQ
jgi:hypothetical protein